MLVRADGSLVMAMHAFRYAIEQGADAVNISFSIPNLGQEGHADPRGLAQYLRRRATCYRNSLVEDHGLRRRQVRGGPGVEIPVPSLEVPGVARRDRGEGRCWYLAQVQDQLERAPRTTRRGLRTIDSKRSTQAESSLTALVHG